MAELHHCSQITEHTVAANVDQAKGELILKAQSNQTPFTCFGVAIATLVDSIACRAAAPGASVRPQRFSRRPVAPPLLSLDLTKAIRGRGKANATTRADAHRVHSAARFYRVTCAAAACL